MVVGVPLSAVHDAGADGKVDTLVTANELYLPIGKTVNFTLQVEGRDSLVLDSGARW